MAGRPSPREEAVLGLTWAVRGLIGFLLLCVLTAVSLLAFVLVYNLPEPTPYQTGQLEQSLPVLSLILIALGTVSGVVFSVGLAHLFGPRRELGSAHAASVGQTTLWLAVTLVLLGASIVVPSITFPVLAFPGVGFTPPAWSLSPGVVLAGLRAVFAGLTLFYAVQGLAEEDARVRLLLGMVLGVVGATVWSGLAAYSVTLGGPSMGSLLPFLAGVVAGLGTSAISLALFIAVYREIRHELATGAGPPA